MKKFLFCCLIFLITLSGCSAAKVKQYKVKVVREYPHDVTSYTQGLFFQDGKLYESTGTDKSKFMQVDLETGKAVRQLNFDAKYFVEGSVVFGEDLYILTWRNRVVFHYSYPDLKYLATYSYPRSGWGLTTDGKQLIASDGTSRLYFMDNNLKVQSSVQVTLHGRPLNLLNELEYIDGRIWANVYTSDLIVIINPATGICEAVIDCEGLLPDKLRTDTTDVLNGIAYDPSTGKIYITGKNWPKLYEIEIEETD